MSAGESSTSGAIESTSGAPTTGPMTTVASTGDPVEAVQYARGMRLTRVTANQGVQTDLVRDGLELPAEELAVRLIARRTTVLRADWLLHAGFAPREIIGRLTIWTPEGDTRVDDFKTMVAGPSNDGDLFTTFSWQLPAELVVPGLQYRIEAIEPDPALASGEVSDPPPILPLPGRGTLVVHDQPMEMQVVIVPLQHEFNGMTCTPEITDADLDAMRVQLEMHNPVERAVLTLHEPYPYTETIGGIENGFVPILMKLGELRAKEKPAANIYYYGLITSCDGYPPGLLGQAYGIPDEPIEKFAFQRIATGRYAGSGKAAAETFVHEIGHTQGRYHVRCSGGEAGTDANYPHSNGRIGVWGYGIHDTQMRSPTGFRDYMTYCPFAWVSDYGWEKTFDTIAALSSWGDAGAPADGVPIVVGAVLPGGQTHFYTTRGAVPRSGRAKGTEVVFAAPGGEFRAAASVLPIPDSDSLAVVAELPAAADAMSQLEVIAAGKPLAKVPAAQIVRLH